MSYADRPTSSVGDSSAQQEKDVNNKSSSGQANIAEKSGEDGDGSHWATKESKILLERALGSTQEHSSPSTEEKTRLGDQNEEIKESQGGDLELGRKKEALSSATIPTIAQVDIQGLKESYKPSDSPIGPITGSPRSEQYLDPTPKTPRASSPRSRATSNVASEFRAPNTDERDVIPVVLFRTSTGADYNAHDKNASDAQPDEGSRSEIQSIMDQFEEFGDGPHEQELMSARLELTSPFLGSATPHPPRKSSLEPVQATSQLAEERPLDRDSVTDPASRTAYPSSYVNDASQVQETVSQTFPVKAPSVRNSSLQQSARHDTPHEFSLQSPRASLSQHKPSPPEPDPEPDLPFDFHRFLEQLRHRTADPVAKFLRSFLLEFGKKQWMVHEQVKIISDFLAFITNKMAQCEVWRGVSDAEFDNAKEGMEKLVMNRLYAQTFSPAIPPPVPVPGAKGKRKNIEILSGPGRRGQHQEDIERDEILGQKVRIYGWVQEEHLDISPIGENGRRFLLLAQQELLKIKTYRAPRDKVICVLNCCKVIFGLLRSSKSADTSADSFVPLLILVVLRANPDHFVSNVQYIFRFRNQEKLGGEAGYYLSSLMGAIQFIESLDRTTLTVSDEEFETNVEAAVSAITERHREDMPQSNRHPQISEKSGLSQPELVAPQSIEAEQITPRKSPSYRDAMDKSCGSDGADENTAVGGLLRTIQRPLSSFGRIFSEETPTQQNSAFKSHAGVNPQPSPAARLSPAVFQPPRDSNEPRRSLEMPVRSQGLEQKQKSKFNAEDAAARQASAEAAEAQRIQSVEHDDVVETLAGMFPDLDRDIIDDVVRQKQGRVGLAVDACLALSS